MSGSSKPQNGADDESSSESLPGNPLKEPVADRLASFGIDAGRARKKNVESEKRKLDELAQIFGDDDEDDAPDGDGAHYQRHKKPKRLQKRSVADDDTEESVSDVIECRSVWRAEGMNVVSGDKDSPISVVVNQKSFNLSKKRAKLLATMLGLATKK